MLTTPHDAIDYACAHSHYLRRLLAADPVLAANLPHTVNTPYTHDTMAAIYLTHSSTRDDALSHALRKLRQAVLAQLIVRDLAGWASLDEVVSSMSTFAEFAIITTQQALLGTLPQYGQPIGEQSGEVQELCVIAMGKLGGGELNVSSDIDLIFVYPESGETNGARVISNHEYFTLLGRKLIQTLSEFTADGFVFRVDMRLRPYGDSGPLVMSFAALENYLLSQGREWERYAWIKAKPLSGDIDGVMQLARPFIYRKYLDYGAYGAMRELYQQIQREVVRRDLVDNIKLGAGGIREIEFIAQVFQLIRGGREKNLQLRSTRATLTRLGELHLLEPQALNELEAAYHWLRKLEHRLQYLDDQQTQTLPHDDDARQRIAQSMDAPDWNSFYAELTQMRRQVSRHFEHVFFLPSEHDHRHPLTELWLDIANTPQLDQLHALGYHDAATVARQLTALAVSQRYQQLPSQNKKRLDALMPALIEVAASTANPEDTLSRVLSLMEAISRRSSYLALLTEHPQTLRRIASLYSASPWVSNYLTTHPILLDELLDARVLYADPDWPLLAHNLTQQLTEVAGDMEAQMLVLRHVHHVQQFRLVVQDLAGMWTVEALSDQLSLLADTLLDACLRHAWQDLKQAHQPVPEFAIIGYGKLGGKELGYASDLDLIFLYDDAHPDAAEIYWRLARTLSTWLTSATTEGILYEVDLRLRPNGAAGLLVSSLEAFHQYQSEKAWLWEHQALTRARFVAGSSRIGTAFERMRKTLLEHPRDRLSLRHEIITMRQRMLESHPARTDDIKHARGGIVDVEFIVQYLVLAYAQQLPALSGNIGNIALLGLASDYQLLSQEHAAHCQAAYRHYRRVQHAMRLNQQTHCPVDTTLQCYYAQVSTVWQCLFLDEK